MFFLTNHFSQKRWCSLYNNPIFMDNHSHTILKTPALHLSNLSSSPIAFASILLEKGRWSKPNTFYSSSPSPLFSYPSLQKPFASPKTPPVRLIPQPGFPQSDHHHMSLPLPGGPLLPIRPHSTLPSRQYVRKPTILFSACPPLLHF